MRYLPLLFSLLPFSLWAETLSLSLKNAPTAEMIAYLAQESGKNVVLSGTIPETKALRLENSHFEAVLQSLSKIHHLSVNQEKAFITSVKTSSPNNVKV